MRYWLLKSEPSTWSWEDQKRKKITSWDGVRNYQAARYMKEMDVGDLAFFYHSVQQKCIVGIVKVVKKYYPDFSDPRGKFGMVDVAYVQDIPSPIALKDIRTTPALQHLPLVRQSRLSVMPVSDKEWMLLLKMGNITYVEGMGN